MLTKIVSVPASASALPTRDDSRDENTLVALNPPCLTNRPQGVSQSWTTAGVCMVAACTRMRGFTSLDGAGNGLGRAPVHVGGGIAHRPPGNGRPGTGGHGQPAQPVPFHFAGAEDHPDRLRGDQGQIKHGALGQLATAGDQDVATRLGHCGVETPRRAACPEPFEQLRTGRRGRA